MNHRFLLLCVIAILSFTLPIPRPATAQEGGGRTPEQIKASYDAHHTDFDYLLGDWEFSSVSLDYGQGRGYWSAVRLAEGAEILDEYRVVGDDGETYRGLPISRRTTARHGSRAICESRRCV